MTGSGIRHFDLRVGVLMHRWPWIGTLADAIGAFRAGLPGRDTLTVSFLGAVNLSKPHEQLDMVFGRILQDAAADGLLTGLDINLLPADLATLDRYLPMLRDLQRSGLRINIHLGELFGAGFSRLVLSRIIPGRIGHGLLLLEDAATVDYAVARWSPGMSPVLIKNPRFLMTSSRRRLATAPRDRQSCSAAQTDLRLAPIHSARSSLLRLTGSLGEPSSSSTRPVVTQAPSTSACRSGRSASLQRPVGAAKSQSYLRNSITF